MEYRGSAQRAASGEDAVLTGALLLGIAIAGGWFLWHRYHPQIAASVIAVQHGQLRIAGHFAGGSAGLDREVRALDPASVSARTLYRLCHETGSYLRVPAALVIAVLAVLCHARNAPSRFTTVHTLDTLMRVQAKVFPTIAAFVDRDLRPTPISPGAPRPLDAALHPREWVDRYARRPGGGFDADAARQELTRQLGPLWRGAGDASPLVRCLLAAFVLHAAREREAARAFLGDFSRSLAPASKHGPGGPAPALGVPAHITAEADRILQRHDLRDLLRIADRHAFTVPALMTLLCEARRRGGVLAPAQFNFVKLIDRRVWYALHALGFPVEDGAEETAMPNPRAEAAGARDHWAAECAQGQPLFVPALDRAVAALRAAA